MLLLFYTAIRRLGSLGLVASAVVGFACGGQQVEPLNPRDLTLPQDTRRWIAAAEDGVVVARARRDAAKVQLNRVQRQQERALLEIDFGSKGAKVVDAMALRFERLTAYLNAQLERAEATLALAEAKYELATAEQAMLHDLARYDLVEVKQNVELARRRLQGSREEVRKGRDALDRATSAFWQAYSRYVKDGGETLPFWIGSQSPQSIAQTDAKNRAPQAQSAPAPSDGGKKELPTNPF